MLQDSFRHQGLRRQLVQQLRDKGIQNEAVLDAIGKIPRHFFMDNAFLEFAYQDKAFPISCGQTISQPYTVAYQSQLLDPRKGDKILEIGTGSGYQSAVLAETGAKVFSIERHKPLHENTRKLLDSLNYHSIKTFFGDGFKGLPAFAPFDKILVTCGATEIPLKLIDQLKVGGIMVIPIGPLSEQTMTTILKKPNGETEIIQLDKFRFVPMLGDKAR
ncbi:MAG: protein-L-isoaspartate(D-aspartate) O-methyltransferase [Bacteroidia bacterium]|nr:protein-L-isoaspartate(D-aspartate) O-methyltransferase [Bacteroidia bacterium]